MISPSHFSAENRKKYGLIVSVVALFSIKLTLLVLLKPVVTPDSLNYSGFADRILGNKDWFYYLDLRAQVLDTTAFRMIGYPLVIAILKILSANGWTYFVCLFQSFLTLYCFSVLYAFGIQNGLPHRFAVLAAIAYCAAYPLYIDQFILTDSIFASLCVIFFCKADRLMFSDSLATKFAYFKIGVIAACLFLIRPTAVIAMLAAVPLFLVSIAKTPALERAERIALLLLPYFFLSICYGAWNYVRSGEFFLTTNGQIVMLQPLQTIASSDPEILEGSDILSRTARDTFKKNNWDELAQTNQKLFDTYRLTGTQIAALATQKYWEVAWRHPKLLLRYAYGEIPWAVMVAPFRILESLKDLTEAANPGSSWPSTRRLLERNASTWKASEILFVSLVNLSRLAGLTITLFFLGGIAARFVWEYVRFRKVHFETKRRFAYCLLFALYIAGHAIFHIEDRYLVPVYAISSIFGMLMLYEYVQRRRSGSF